MIVVPILLGWLAAQPVLVLAWSRIMRSRREQGGN